MSEYQYYEFQAVDRPLTTGEIAKLRAISTRARITPTQLQNVYHFGDFKGKPLDLMERYFDAFVYVANWGTHQFMVRLPQGLLDPRTVELYAVEDSLHIHTKGDAVILEFISHDDEGGGWIDDEEAEAWMPALIPLRADLASGDMRALYMAWLAAAAAGGLDAEDGEFDDFDDLDEDDDLDREALEPPVPPGLGNLSASLAALATFLRVDDDLLAVAAAGSARLPEAPSAADLQRWIARLPSAEKDALLLLLADNAAPARVELLRRFRQANATPSTVRADARTVGVLLAAAEERAAARERQEAERQAAERARREREEAAARAKHLDSLTGREEELWRQVDERIETKRPKEYDRAVQLLQDLHDLNVRQECDESFADRLGLLRERFATRRGLLDRLDRAGLNA